MAHQLSLAPDTFEQIQNIIFDQKYEADRLQIIKGNKSAIRRMSVRFTKIKKLIRQSRQELKQRKPPK